MSETIRRTRGYPAGGMRWVVVAAAAMLVGASPAASQPAIAEVVRIELAVENRASTATGARAANDLAVQRVVRALGRSGVMIGEIRTLHSVVHAEYEPRGVIPVTTIRDDRRLRGFRAATRLRVTTADAEQVGWLLDVAAAAGAHPQLAVQLPAAVP